MANLYGPKIVTSGLQVCLDAGNNKSYSGSGAVFTDLTGRYNGSLFYSPTYSSSNKGKFTFNGTSQHIVLANANAHAWTQDGSVGTTELSFEFWFRGTKADNGNQLLMCKPWNGSGQYNYFIRLYNFTVWINSGSSTISYPSSLQDSNWHHLIVWVNTINFGYYIDGNRLSGSGGHGRTGGATPAGNDAVAPNIGTIISGYGTTSYYFGGDLAIFRKYNRVLSSSEALQNYNATKGRFGL